MPFHTAKNMLNHNMNQPMGGKNLCIRKKVIFHFIKTVFILFLCSCKYFWIFLNPNISLIDKKISKFTEEVDLSVSHTCLCCNFAGYKGQFPFLNSTKSCVLCVLDD